MDENLDEYFGTPEFECALMSSNDYEKKIKYAEKRVLIAQSRIIEQLNRAKATMRMLEREKNNLAGQREEWMKKRSIEEERIRLEEEDLKRVHRTELEELKLQHRQDTMEKLKDISIEIESQSREYDDLRKIMSKGLTMRRNLESKIRSEYQVKINEILRQQGTIARCGVSRAHKRTFPEVDCREDSSLEMLRSIGTSHVGNRIRNVQISKPRRNN